MMAETGRIGASEPPSEGERIERGRRRRRFAIFAVLAALAFPAGFLAGFTEADELFVAGDRWPPALAAGLSIAYLVLVTVGSVLLAREIDEVERAARYKAISAAAIVYVIVYPVWFLWWKGGFVPEPMHAALYIAFMAVFLLASLFYRFR